mgnify:CR=1 FL=1
MEPKVIFHIDELPKWRLLLNNAANLAASYKGKVPGPAIEVVANSEAVKGYLPEYSAAYFSDLEALAWQGIRFAACNHSMRGLNIAADQLPAFVTVVPAGVRELADRQMEGYAYLKP